MYLYIVGRGHSGSTILDVLLGNSVTIESVGELLSGLSRADHERCSCGAVMPKCQFWREVRSQVEAAGFSWDEVRHISQTGAAGFWRVWRASRADPTMARRGRITRALAGAITAAAGKRHLLDSSKTPAHGLLLLRQLPEARLIHLVRDPRGVLKSHVSRMRQEEHLSLRRYPLAGRSSFSFLTWMAASWTVVNLACDLMALFFRGRVVRVRFEDLCAHPAEELGRIGRACGLDLADVISKATNQEPLVVGHNIGGNRLRHARGVRFQPSGGQVHPPLPRWLKAVTVLLCGALMWRYGYSLGAGGTRPARSNAVLPG